MLAPTRTFLSKAAMRGVSNNKTTCYQCYHSPFARVDGYTLWYFIIKRKQHMSFKRLLFGHVFWHTNVVDGQTVARRPVQSGSTIIKRYPLYGRSLFCTQEKNPANTIIRART